MNILIVLFHVQTSVLTVLAVKGMSPVFGILAQPEADGNSTFIVSSYVKWLESAGARVVPIRPDAPEPEVNFIMARVNGMVFPGGSSTTDPTADGYGKVAYNVYKIAVERKIPVWGTCLGHEQILRFATYAAGEANPLGHFPSEGYALPITFAADAATSTLYQSMPLDMRRALTSQNLTINLHTQGVGSKTFHESEELTNTFHMVATGVDTLGDEFVALTQHKYLPIVTAQFHIEKNPYEFQQGHYDGAGDDGSASPHGTDGIRVAHHLAAWLVDEARKGKFSWSPSSLDKWIIYNWPASFSHKVTGTAWEQQYTFPPHDGILSSDVGELVGTLV